MLANNEQMMGGLAWTPFFLESPLFKFFESVPDFPFIIDNISVVFKKNQNWFFVKKPMLHLDKCNQTLTIARNK